MKTRQAMEVEVPQAFLRRDARDTSKAAALATAPRSGTRRALILEMLNQATDGMTDDQLIEASGLPHQSVGPRRLELEQGDWVRDSGRRRPTRTGALAIVWVPTSRARVAWIKARVARVRAQEGR